MTQVLQVKILGMENIGQQVCNYLNSQQEQQTKTSIAVGWIKKKKKVQWPLPSMPGLLMA